MAVIHQHTNNVSIHILVKHYSNKTYRKLFEKVDTINILHLTRKSTGPKSALCDVNLC